MKKIKALSLKTMALVLGAGLMFAAPNTAYATEKASDANAMLSMTNTAVIVAEDDEGNTYTSLEDAIKGVEKYGTITLMENAYVESVVVIPESKRITLDLNGFDIEAGWKTEDVRHHYAIDNYGRFTLKDSSNGEGEIFARGIENFGRMTIEGGTIWSIDTNGGAAVWNEGKLYIKQGTFIAEKSGTSPGPGCLNTREGARTIIYDGTFTSDASGTYAIINEGKMSIKDADVTAIHGAIATAGSTTINDGNYICKGIEGQSDHVLYLENGGTLTVKGGSFKGSGQGSGDSNIYVSSGTSAYVKGGTFNEDISKKSYFLDAYQIKDNGDGTYSVVIKPEAVVATCDDKGYATLQDAIDDADTGATVTLCKSLTENVEIYDDIVLDLGGNTLTSASSTVNLIQISSGNVLIENGKLSAPGTTVIRMTGVEDPEDEDLTTTVTVADDVVIEGGYGVVLHNKDAYGFDDLYYGMNLTMNGTINATTAGIWVMGNITDDEDTNFVTVGENANIKAGVGICMAGDATVTVEGNVIATAESGIEVRAGELLVVDGAKVESKATPTSSSSSGGDGSATKGAAVAIAQHTTDCPISVTISGGTFTGETALYESNPEGNTNVANDIELTIIDGTFISTGDNVVLSDNLESFICGGTYNTEPDEKYIDVDYIAIQEAENEWHVLPKDDYAGTTGNVNSTDSDVSSDVSTNNVVTNTEIPEGTTTEEVAGAVEKLTEELTTNESAMAPATNLSSAASGILSDIKDDETAYVYVKVEVKDMNVEVVVEGEGEDKVTSVVPTKLVFEADAFMKVLNDENKVTVPETEIDNSKLNGKRFSFRLPIPNAVDATYAKVVHKADDGSTDTYYLPIQKDGDEQYIEVTVRHFSEFEVTFTDTKPNKGSYSTPISSSSTKRVVKKETAAVTGAWAQDANGWWYRYADGTWPAAKWVELDWNGEKTWYYFNQNGYMHSGWLLDGGLWYFLHNVSDGTQGYMYTGWKQIDGKWYYFNPMAGGPKGSLLVNTVTPDGYTVDANGVWVQ